MEYWKRIIRFIFNLLPFVLICSLISTVIINGIFAIFNISSVNIFNILYFIVFIVSIFIFKNNLHDFSFSLKENFVLFMLAMLLIIYRFPIYFHASDDYVLHMDSGYLSKTLWSNNSFMPLDFFTYTYPLQQIPYSFLIEIFGIRLSILLLCLSSLFWYLSLNRRYNDLICVKKNKNKRIYINLFFIFLYFLPELLLSSTCFMTDFLSVLLALESLFWFLKRKKIFWAVILSVLSVLTKQSSGLFLLIIYLVLYSRSYRLIRKDFFKIVVFAILVISFFVRCYLVTGNPFSFLLNSIFKSPLYSLDNFRDWRWGPQNFLQVISWPFNFYNQRYIEFVFISKYSKFFFGLFLVLPYVLSFIFLVWKKKYLYFIFLLSIFFWSWQSGYGRYQIAMNSIIWIFIVKEIISYLPIINIKFSILLYVVFGLFSISSFRNDFALRGFILEKFYPPKISEYFKDRFIEGTKYIGKDRYIDIYSSLKNFYSGFDLISIVGRGDSTYYAFIAHKYINIPIFSSITNDQYEKIIYSSKVSNKLKLNLLSINNYKNVLLIADKHNEYMVYDSYIYKKYKCIKLNRDKITPQFEHDNYFNYVIEYSCSSPN